MNIGEIVHMNLRHYLHRIPALAVDLHRPAYQSQFGEP